MSNCPLCRSTDCRVIEQFSALDLIHIAPRKYRRILEKNLHGVDTFKVNECSQCGLLHFDPLVSGSEEFYRLLSKEPYYYKTFKPEYGIIEPWLPRPLRLLEVGCGAGHFAAYLKDHVDTYHGLEFNSDAIQRGRSTGVDITSEPIEEFARSHQGEFNAVGSFQVLEHVADVHSFITASLACLEEDGVFFLAVPNQDSFVGRASDEMLNLPPHHLTRWPRKAVENLAGVFSLELLGVVEEELADYHLPLYAQTCYRLGGTRHTDGPVPCVSSNPRIRSLAARCFARFVLNPILIRAIVGMRSLLPYPKGHTICDVYRKVCLDPSSQKEV